MTVTPPRQPPARRHVLHLIDSIDIGGAEQLLVEMAEAPDRPFQMSVAALREPMTPSSVRPRLSAAGVMVEVFPMTGPGLSLRPRELVRMGRWCRSAGIDVIHTHVNSSHVVGGAVAKVLRLPSVATLHAVSRGDSSWRERVRLAVLRRADRIVAVGPGVAESFAGSLGSDITVVPNPVPRRVGVDRDEARAALNKELDIRDDATLLLAVGRLRPQKNHHLMLDAFALVLDEVPDAHLVIAGTGPLYAQLLQYVEDSGLADRAHLLGPRQDVEQLIGAADVFVSSSDWEGLPLSILEAMSGGLPVVATDVGDCHFAVGDGGVLVSPQDAAALAAGIVSLLVDPDRRSRVGAAAADRARDEFTISVWVRRLDQVYASLVR